MAQLFCHSQNATQGHFFKKSIPDLDINKISAIRLDVIIQNKYAFSLLFHHGLDQTQGQCLSGVQLVY